MFLTPKLVLKQSVLCMCAPMTGIAGPDRLREPDGGIHFLLIACRRRKDGHAMIKGVL